MSSQPDRYSGKTIAILGLSYCGSTVLNYVLDTHPSIYGGSELSRLFSERHSPSCAICGEECPYWTPERIAAISAAGPGQLYENLAALFRVPVICDSSKQLGHVLNVMESDAHTEFLFVVLTKHPLRHVASFVTNDFYKKARILAEEDIANTQETRHDEIMAFAMQAASRISDFHSLLTRRDKRLRQRGTVVTVTYESLMCDLPTALQPMLDFADLEYEPAMADYSAYEHHPIGGNMGPHVQTWKRHGVKGAWGATAGYRRTFYQQARNLVMDDKYRTTFSPRQIDILTGAHEIRELCGALGYEPLS